MKFKGKVFLVFLVIFVGVLAAFFIVRANGNVEKTYVGAETCKGCHDEAYKQYDQTPHRKTLLDSALKDDEKGCEACHGPGSAHVEGGGDKTKIISFKGLSSKEVNQICLKCHSQTTMLFQWNSSEHATKNLSCISCHNPHNYARRNMLEKKGSELCFECHKDKKLEASLPSHHPILEGKMECYSCHNPHGGAKDNLKAEKIVELCIQCHADKSGPFRFEHPPVEEDCLYCHKPHGSVNDRLLAQTVPFLCYKCHAIPHVVAFVPGTDPLSRIDRFEFRIGCTNCHSAIHGSDRHEALRF
ncbi:MAG: DmsE family decaheme c-type cytochrome [Firmicutes bacterium]|nr:DmsE family decaheme c-type cytochrome [Bacillota bacterium]